MDNIRCILMALFRRQTACGVLAALCFTSCGSLPDVSRREVSPALPRDGKTTLARRAAPLKAEHPGLTGAHLLVDGRDAFAARLALADTAERSLDMQYFIWTSDLTGKMLAEKLLLAADRGVRVRIQIDDMGAMQDDRDLLALDSHPNIEIRLFNPTTLRSPRYLGFLVQLPRVNRRMHNKSYTADGEVTIIGGRNIADEYFSANEERNFSDLDVAMIGPAVPEVTKAFDMYWNCRASIGISELRKGRKAADEAARHLAEIRTGLEGHAERVKQSPYGKSVRQSMLAGDMKSRSARSFWAPVRVVYDHPDKAVYDDPRMRMAPALAAEARAAKRELYVVSPYFIPGKQGAALFLNARNEGKRVVVITNSLASTDGNVVHAKYMRYRRELLEAGVEMYEMKAASGAERVKLRWGVRGRSLASLHAKTFSFDRRTIFVGSYNLTPRSQKLNTETGAFIESPKLAAGMPETMNRMLPTEAYRVVLEGDRLVWITQEKGQEVRLYHEPGTTGWRRFQVRLMSLLPIEGLL